MLRALILALILALPSGAALAQSASGSTTMQVYITRTGDGPASEVLDLPLSKAAIIHLPVDAADVLVTNPEVADAVIRTPTRAYLLGQSIGQTNAFFFDAEGRMIFSPTTGFRQEQVPAGAFVTITATATDPRAADFRLTLTNAG